METWEPGEVIEVEQDMDLQEELNAILDRYICEEDKLKGKVISHTYRTWDRVILVFTDGTYTAIEGEEGWDEESISVCFNRPQVSDLVAAGLLRKEVVESLRKEKEDKEKEDRRRRWEQLNKEFGTLNSPNK